MKINQKNNSSDIYVSATVGAYGKNTLFFDVYKHSINNFYVTDSYTASSSTWDRQADGYKATSVYTDDFVFNILGLDPTMWSVVDGKLLKLN